jgi:chorismate mutase
MPCRGIRGATTVKANTRSEILDATRELLAYLVKANQLTEEDVASIFFTVTPDLTAAFPAEAARQLGWQHTALLDAQEIPVPGGIPHCIRILIHWNTDRPQADVEHAYLRGAAALRPDLTGG